MKALLVIDMPNSCEKCPLNSHTEYDFDVCWVTQGKGGCPLRPLPEECDDATEIYNAHGEIDCYQLTEYARGYNACLEEIQNDN